jgi:hypothetical protein
MPVVQSRARRSGAPSSGVLRPRTGIRSEPRAQRIHAEHGQKWPHPCARPELLHAPAACRASVCSSSPELGRVRRVHTRDDAREGALARAVLAVLRVRACRPSPSDGGAPRPSGAAESAWPAACLRGVLQRRYPSLRSSQGSQELLARAPEVPGRCPDRAPSWASAHPRKGPGPGRSRGSPMRGVRIAPRPPQASRSRHTAAGWLLTRAQKMPRMLASRLAPRTLFA